MAPRVQRHEVMDRAIVANSHDGYAWLFRLSGVGPALIAQRIVLRRDDECGRQQLASDRHVSHYLHRLPPAKPRANTAERAG
jgi:hypothetical protein